MYFYKVSILKDKFEPFRPISFFPMSHILLIGQYRYAYGKFSNSHEATIGGCFLTKNEDLGDYIVKYEMWDTAGQERYKSLA